MPIDIYYSATSAPSRSVIMVAQALNIEFNPIKLDLFEKEQFKPEFLNINPQHCVPTIVDDSFLLWESRAIMTYLVNKYGKGSLLYPEDPQQRARVDQRLYFEIGILYARFIDVVPQLLANQPADEAKLKRLQEALELLDTFLLAHEWAAGPHPTVADFSLFSTVSHCVLMDIDISKYANVKAWLERARVTIPECNKTETFIENGKKILAKLKNKNVSQ